MDSPHLPSPGGDGLGRSPGQHMQSPPVPALPERDIRLAQFKAGEFSKTVAVWMHSGNSPREWNSREEALTKCFEHLDTAEDGSLQLRDISRMVKSINPKTNLEESKRLMQQMDINQDSKVSKEEFIKWMMDFHKDTDEDTFQEGVKDIIYRGQRNDDGSYVHPSNNHAYLKSSLLPVLQEGILALVKYLEEHRIRDASWEDFPTNELPDVWSPLCPLEWLADYLQQNNPNLYHSQAIQPKQWSELTRQEKLEMCFKHLDRDGSGCLDARELMAIASKVNPQQDMEEAKEYMQWLDNNEDGEVSWEEYFTAMDFLMGSLSDEEFEEGVQRILNSSHLSFFSRQEKLMMVFCKMDVNNDGDLDLDEMMTFAKLFGRNSGKVDIQKVKRTILWMDKDGDRKVNGEEFLAAMSELTNHLPEETFDIGIQRMLTAYEPVLEDEVDPTEGMHKKLAETAREMPTHPLARQMGVREAMRYFMEAEDEGSKPLLFIDLRTEQETAVSAIPNAVLMNLAIEINDLDILTTDMSFLWDKLDLPAQEVATDKKGDKKAAEKKPPPKKGEADGEKVKIADEAVVICYDTMGLRGGLAAIALEKALGRPVYNLCGGVFAWYNEAGKVVNAEGEEVHLLHPFQKFNMGYIKRKNGFKAKDLVVLETAKEKSKKTKSRFANKK